MDFWCQLYLNDSLKFYVHLEGPIKLFAFRPLELFRPFGTLYVNILVINPDVRKLRKMTIENIYYCIGTPGTLRLTKKFAGCGRAKESYAASPFIVVNRVIHAIRQVGYVIAGSSHTTAYVVWSAFDAQNPFDVNRIHTNFVW